MKAKLIFIVLLLLVASFMTVYAFTFPSVSDLPIIGASTNTWGVQISDAIMRIVNATLNEHETDGTHANITASAINSTEGWDNVSITESQISNLIHTTDTDTRATTEQILGNFSNSTFINLTIVDGKILINVSITQELCILLTGSIELCDGTDAVGTDASSYNRENNFTPDYADEYAATGFHKENASLLPFSNFGLANVSNDTTNQQGLIDFNNSLTYTTMNLENVSNTTSPENMANADFTDFSCDGSGLCTLDANVCDSTEIAINAVKDDEVDYSAVTLIDFTNDPKFISNTTDLNVNVITATNLTIKENTNATLGKFSVIQFNSSCSGFRFNNSLTAGGLFSCEQ